MVVGLQVIINVHRHQSESSRHEFIQFTVPGQKRTNNSYTKPPQTRIMEGKRQDSSLHVGLAVLVAYWPFLSKIYDQYVHITSYRMMRRAYT